jgi:hypothetical protein
MAKKQAKPAIEIPLTGDVQDLLVFWKACVSGRIIVKDESGKEQTIVVPLEVRLRASDLLAKHVMPKGGRFVEEETDDMVTATPDILHLASMLETKAADDLLARAYEAVRSRKER